MQRNLFPFLLMAILLSVSCQSPEKEAAKYYNRGIEKGIRGDSDGALTDFSMAIRIRPDFAEAYHNRGFYCHLPAGNLQLAYEDFDQAVTLLKDQGDAYSLSMRGITRLRLGDTLMALKDVETSLARDSLNSYAWYNLARIRLAMRDTLAACSALKMAEKHNFSKDYGPEAASLSSEICH